ncbi:unnamed protein product [Camellia sinensis]
MDGDGGSAITTNGSIDLSDGGNLTAVVDLTNPLVEGLKINEAYRRRQMKMEKGREPWVEMYVCMGEGREREMMKVKMKSTLKIPEAESQSWIRKSSNGLDGVLKSSNG